MGGSVQHVSQVVHTTHTPYALICPKANVNPNLNAGPDPDPNPDPNPDVMQTLHAALSGFCKWGRGSGSG